MQKSQVSLLKAQGAPTSLQLGEETKEDSPELLEMCFLINWVILVCSEHQ